MQVPSDVQDAVASVTGKRVGQVTVRRGAAIDQAASHLAADSYATDGVIHLPGKAPLTSDRSRMLLAHELTHVVQQRAGTAPSHEGSPAGVAAERQALSVEQALVNARVPAGSPGAPPSTGPTSLGIAPGTGGGAGAGQRPVVARSTEAVSPDRAASLPRATVERPSPARAGATGGGDGGNPLYGTGAGAGDPRVGPAGAPGSPAAGAAPMSRMPVPVTNTPVPRPPSPPQGPNPAAAPSGADAAAVQRRASSGAGAPPRPPAKDSHAAKESGDASGSRSGSRRNADAPPPPDTATDDLWLERHARALYPHIRLLLRSEFFRDRERRGRLMRED